eukprot:Blabericola_migrator_1__2001@NODE_1547_length_4305_cov_162_802029_g1014_i0_p3_GENE_NODE_1547_length_4305_cov_162_802029_g1014_i0NODE_1547_length_4305_cov_162_802029_g1014_i0_p3_ORF_typecomplete_len238_score35_58EMP70/PF02990_16/1_3e42_NODE_1547_length_4305_cov_162_802029_g1014_i025443257
MHWKSTTVWQLVAFPLLALGVYIQLNTAYAAFGSTLAVSLGKIMSAILVFLIFHTPLQYAGAVFGRQKALEYRLPVKPNLLERPIPNSSWLTKASMAMLSGALPFGSLALEAYFIYESFWTHRNYFFYGFFLAVIILYGSCMAASGVTALYILLNKEDHRWQWFTFACGASTGLYLLAYSVFYYHSVLSSTAGFFHGFTYWIYTTLACVGLATASGAVSTLASQIFMARIYMNGKSD